MLEISILPPVKGGKEDFRNVDRISVNYEVVLTTEQLAEFYGCKVIQVQQNFNNNKEHFVEGKHYFKLEGKDLKNFKNNHLENFEMPLKFASHLYLWTKKGVARHSKMLQTEKAWAVFEQMEDAFFIIQGSDVDLFKKEIEKEIENEEKKLKSILERLSLAYTILQEQELSMKDERFKLEAAIERLNDKNFAVAKQLKELAKSTDNKKLRDKLIKEAATRLLGKEI